jgi:hypothetical protein
VVPRALPCQCPPRLFESITPQRRKSFKKKRSERKILLEKSILFRKDSTMTGVIAVMKPSLESRKMCKCRVSLGSLVASAAVCCVLSHSAVAKNSGVGFINGPAEINYRVKSIDESRNGFGFSVRLNRDGGRPIGELGEIEGVERPLAGQIRLSGTTLTPDSATVEDETNTSNDPTGSNPTTGSTKIKPTDPAGDEFTGSAAPAGPDLDSSAEKDLISGGWN